MVIAGARASGPSREGPEQALAWGLPAGHLGLGTQESGWFRFCPHCKPWANSLCIWTSAFLTQHGKGKLTTISGAGSSRFVYVPRLYLLGAQKMLVDLE